MKRVWSTENPRASRALKQALDPGWHKACFAHIKLALLTGLGLATLTIFGLGRTISFSKIRIFCHGNIHILSCTYINYKLKILKKRYEEKCHFKYIYLTLKMQDVQGPGPWPIMYAQFAWTTPFCAIGKSQNLRKNLLRPRPNPGSASATTLLSTVLVTIPWPGPLSLVKFHSIDKEGKLNRWTEIFQQHEKASKATRTYRRHVTRTENELI